MECTYYVVHTILTQALECWQLEGQEPCESKFTGAQDRAQRGILGLGHHSNNVRSHSTKGPKHVNATVYAPRITQLSSQNAMRRDINSVPPQTSLATVCDELLHGAIYFHNLSRQQGLPL